jgi:hypothetical protein
MAKQFANVKSYNDLAYLFDELNSRLIALRAMLACPGEDARHVLLGGAQIVVAGYAMGFRAMWYGRRATEPIAYF